MDKTYKLHNLSKEEYDELKSCEDVYFALIENHPIHNTYTVTVKIKPSTEKRESKVETFIDSYSAGGKDHRIDRFSRDFDYLKQELGVGKYKQKKKIPQTLSEAVTEISDKIEQEIIKENLGLKDHTND